MRLCAAIPIAEQEQVLLLPQLFESLQHHGFDEVLLLWTGEGKKASPEGSLRVVRAHPDYVLEAAMHECRSDWVFILYPGETLEQCERPLKRILGEDHPDRTWAALNMEAQRVCEIGKDDFFVRGFRNHVVTNGGMGNLEHPLIQGWAKGAEPHGPPPPDPTGLDLTVVLPAWRLGGLDVTLEHLDRQEGYAPNDREGVQGPAEAPAEGYRFELIIVDALHRWRHDRIYTALEGYREHFDILHLPIDGDVFPLSSHSRFRNTAIRRARGRRIIFLSEYACPPPSFLQKHLGVAPDAIGIGPWLRTVINPNALECPLGMTVWDVMEKAQKGRFVWSAFRKGVDPFGQVIARFPQWPQANLQMGTQEYLGHWKSDSAPTDLVRRVNGWDESFDGQGDCADTDFTLRLLWAGAKMQILDVETPVLDAHVISVAPLTDKTRSNPHRLYDTKAKRMMRCVHGLTKGIIND